MTAINYRISSKSEEHTISLYTPGDISIPLGLIIAATIIPDSPVLLVRKFMVPSQRIHDKAIEILFKLSHEKGCKGRIAADTFWPTGFERLQSAYKFRAQKYSDVWPDLLHDHDALAMAIDFRQASRGKTPEPSAQVIGDALQHKHSAWCDRLVTHAEKALGRTVTSLPEAIIWGLYCLCVKGEPTIEPFQGRRLYLTDKSAEALKATFKAPLTASPSGLSFSFSRDATKITVFDAVTTVQVGVITYRKSDEALEITSLEIPRGLDPIMPAMLEAAYRTSLEIGAKGHLIVRPPKENLSAYQGIGFVPLLHSDLRGNEAAHTLALRYLKSPTVANGRLLVEDHLEWVEKAKAHLERPTNNLSEILLKGLYTPFYYRPLTPATKASFT